MLATFWCQPAAASEDNFVPKVRIIYLVPADKKIREDYKEAMETIALEVQRWYGFKMGAGKTFTLSDPIVEVYQSHKPEPRCTF